MNYSIFEADYKDAQYTLYDERDNQRKYYVAKLADGNIWMTENLDLNLATNKTLTTNDTDVPVNWTPVRGDSNIWTYDTSTPYSYDASDRCWNGTITSTNYPISDNTVAKNCNKHDSSHYHVGNYYNWTAAVAMNNSQYYTADKQNVNQSICPKGWQLPIQEGDKSFVSLQSKTNFISGPSGNIHQAPFYLAYDGDLYVVTGGTPKVNYVGYYGTLWSSVLNSSYSAYYLFFNQSEDLYLQYINTRQVGRAVRCVARTGGTEDISGPKTISDISTMQQYGNLPKENKAAIKASMTTNTQYELKDERDQRMYYIAKLADGNIWMTENLDLALSPTKTLTPNDTDIKSNWTPSRKTLEPSEVSSWQYDDYVPYSYNPGNYCWNGTIITVDNKAITDSSVSKTCDTPHNENNHYHVGNFYNWTAAAAMENSSTHGIANVDQSICPKGWRLPARSGDKSIANLKTFVVGSSGTFDAGTSGNVHKSPWYFTYAGNWSSSPWGGAAGGFWTSYTPQNNTASAWIVDYGGTNSYSVYSRNAGLSVRCVARDE